MNNDLLIPELNMFITKTSISQDGVMRWAAVNSDIDWDLYGERMSLELYQKMIGYIKNSQPPPAQFKSAVCSDYWCGGLPYVSIAHYGDGNGKAVPGEVMELFVDGGQLKAKGILFNNDLGSAVWKSLKEDEKINPQNEDKIRISIGFLDLAHKHGDNGNVFYRSSLASVCSDCVQGVGNKIYLDGYLVHLALTRVPVNPRTEMKVDKGMANKPKTKKEDALSVVKSEEIVQEIVETNGVEEKSVLVEMSEADDVSVVISGTNPDALELAKNAIQIPALVEDSKAKVDTEEYQEDDEKKKDKKVEKSLTAEDVTLIVGIVKSTLAEMINPVPSILVDSTVPNVNGMVVPAKSILDESIEELYTSIKSAVESNSPLEAKLQVIQPQLEKLGNSIITTVKSSVAQTPDTVSNDSGQILTAIQELSQTVTDLRSEVAILKAQPVVNIEQPRVPSPRSVSPNLVSQALQAKAQNAPKPGSVAEISRRSVGLLD